MRTEAPWQYTGFAEEIVEAMAIVSAQANLSPNEALALMKARARSSGLSLEQVAIEVLAGEMRFDD